MAAAAGWQGGSGVRAVDPGLDNFAVSAVPKMVGRVDT